MPEDKRKAFRGKGSKGIINLTRDTVISASCRVVSSYLGKAWGLMLSTKVRVPLVFVFSPEQAVSLHMLFVFCPIDVILLGSHRRVVEIKESLKPFTFYMSRKKAKYVIELSAGSIRKSRTGVGDRIQIQQGSIQKKSDTPSHTQITQSVIGPKKTRFSLGTGGIFLFNGFFKLYSAPETANLKF